MVATLSFIAQSRAVTRFPKFEHWLTAALMVTLAVNIVVTSLICWKIWYAAAFLFASIDLTIIACRRIGKGIPAGTKKSNRQYYAIMHALIESGGIYSAVLIVHTAFRISSLRTGFIFMYYVLPQVVGIAPTLIIIRLHSLPLQQPNDIESSNSHQCQHQASSELTPRLSLNKTQDDSDRLVDHHAAIDECDVTEVTQTSEHWISN
ncbi:hypothetical protein FRC03_012461 [Tulasnella sp. 419]|nr:hypothetical protein FRC03_012461 [Tulasnella sp. 419]